MLLMQGRGNMCVEVLPTETKLASSAAQAVSWSHVEWAAVLVNHVIEAVRPSTDHHLKKIKSASCVSLMYKVPALL